MWLQCTHFDATLSASTLVHLFSEAVLTLAINARTSTLPYFHKFGMVPKGLCPHWEYIYINMEYIIVSYMYKLNKCIELTVHFTYSDLSPCNDKPCNLPVIYGR